MKDLYWILGVYITWCIFWIKISLHPLVEKLVRKRDWCQDCWLSPLLALVYIALSGAVAHILLWESQAVNTEAGKAIALSFDRYTWWVTPTLILVYQLIRWPYRVKKEAQKVWPTNVEYVQLPLKLYSEEPECRQQATRTPSETP